MLERADAVVIGSGALGGAMAWHLATAGMHVALLDQHEIGSQTSPRAAGLSAQIRPSELMTRLAVRGVEKLLAFTGDTGQPLDVHRSGSLKVARTDAHARQVEGEVARGRAYGVPVEMVSAARAQKLNPFLRAGGHAAYSFCPGDVYLDPAQLTRGYAAAAAALGCVLLPHTGVEEIVVEGGAVAGVRTASGTLRAPVVVDAAGAWLRAVASAAAAALPMLAVRHQLLITAPIAGVEALQPITRVLDANVYIRPCDGGLMVGGYEADPLLYDELPSGFAIADMPLDATVLHRLADRIAGEFPILREVGRGGVAVAVLRGGLPTMTADDEHLIGPAPGIAGLFVIGGCNVGGLSTAPAFAEALTEIIQGRRAPSSLAPLLPERFAGAAVGAAVLRDACRTHYAWHYSSEAARGAALRAHANGPVE